MAKKMAVKQQVEEAAEEAAETPKSNVKKLVKKETPAPAAKEKKEKAPPKEVNENEVTLKEICDEHDLNATTARVKLRRKFGAQGLRYVWEKDSDELAAVIELLTAKPEKAEKEEKAPAAKKTSKKKAAPAPEPEDEEGKDEEGEEGEEVDPE